MKEFNLEGLIICLLAVLILPACQDTQPTEQDEVVQDEREACQSCGIDYFSMDPFPQSDGFPLPASTIEGWVTNREGHAIRSHGWSLFAGLMDEVGSPHGDRWRYRTWPTATQAFEHPVNPNDPTGHGTHHQEVNFLRVSPLATAIGETNQTVTSTPNYPVPAPICGWLQDSIGDCSISGGCQFQDNGDILIAGVIYNQPAFDHIRNNDLYSWETLKEKWITDRYASDPAKRAVPDFPANSIVLKPMLWPVRGDSVMTPLPIFPITCYEGSEACGSIYDSGNYWGYENQKVWENAIAISTTTPKLNQKKASLTYLFGAYTDSKDTLAIDPITYQNLEVHGLDEFYHWKVSQEEWDAMGCMDKAIISKSAYYTYGREFQPGDYLALVAMHVMTKEIPGWTFQSFWWDNTVNGQNDKHAKQRNSVNSPPMSMAFNSYLMTSTYGMNAINTEPKEWPVAYNPYIELAASHPIKTNCKNCHMRSAFPNAFADKAGLKGQIITNTSAYFRPGKSYPSMLDTFNFGNPVYDSLITLDALWSISDRVAPPTSKK